MSLSDLADTVLYDTDTHDSRLTHSNTDTAEPAVVVYP